VTCDDLWRSTWRSLLPYSLTFELEIVVRERGCRLLAAT
jgi:hypothetical protein